MKREKKRIIVLTGVSASGKTTLQEELLKRGWSRPLNFTTRKPRTEDVYSIDEDGDFNSEELNEYIFLTPENFHKKYKNGDFIEFTSYGGNNYGASRILPDGNVCIILDPIGRSQVLEYFTRRGIYVETYYIEIPRDVQIERLEKRGEDEKQILSRKRDFEWFSPTNKCIRLNGTKPVEELISIIDNHG